MNVHVRPCARNTTTENRNKFVVLTTGFETFCGKVLSVTDVMLL